MALTEERRAALLAYCKLTELKDDPEVQQRVAQEKGLVPKDSLLIYDVAN